MSFHLAIEGRDQTNVVSDSEQLYRLEKHDRDFYRAIVSYHHPADFITDWAGDFKDNILAICRIGRDELSQGRDDRYSLKRFYTTGLEKIFAMRHPVKNNNAPIAEENYISYGFDFDLSKLKTGQEIYKPKVKVVHQGPCDYVAIGREHLNSMEKRISQPPSPQIQRQIEYGRTFKKIISGTETPIHGGKELMRLSKEAGVGLFFESGFGWLFRENMMELCRQGRLPLLQAPRKSEIPSCFSSLYQRLAAGKEDVSFPLARYKRSGIAALWNSAQVAALFGTGKPYWTEDQTLAMAESVNNFYSPRLYTGDELSRDVFDQPDDQNKIIFALRA